MKQLTLVLFILISLSAFSQTNCSDVKLGIYKVIGKNMGNSIIERKGDVQIEYTEKIKMKVEYALKWIDDCTYTLTFNKIIEDPYGFGTNEDIKYTIEILEVTKDGYIQKVSSSDLDFTFESNVQRMD